MALARNARRSDDEPIDLHTRLCNEALQLLEKHPEVPDDFKAIITIDFNKHGGSVAHGFEDDDAFLTALLRHAEAVAKANGMNLQVHTVGEG